MLRLVNSVKGGNEGKWVHVWGEDPSDGIARGTYSSDTYFGGPVKQGDIFKIYVIDPRNDSTVTYEVVIPNTGWAMSPILISPHEFISTSMPYVLGIGIKIISNTSMEIMTKVAPITSSGSTNWGNSEVQLIWRIEKWVCAP